VADGFRVMDLIARTHGNLLGGMIATCGDIDQIDAFLLHELGEGDRLGEIPACAEGFGGPVGGGDADKERQMLGPRGADGANDLEWEADAVVEAAAVLVGAVIGQGREKLMEQVAMGGVDFDEVEASAKGSMSG